MHGMRTRVGESRQFVLGLIRGNLSLDALSSAGSYRCRTTLSSTTYPQTYAISPRLERESCREPRPTSRIATPRLPHPTVAGYRHFITVFNASAQKLKAEADSVREALAKERANAVAAQEEAAALRRALLKERDVAQQKVSMLETELDREREVRAEYGREGGLRDFESFAQRWQAGGRE